MIEKSITTGSELLDVISEHSEFKSNRCFAECETISVEKVTNSSDGEIFMIVDKRNGGILQTNRVYLIRLLTLEGKKYTLDYRKDLYI